MQKKNKNKSKKYFDILFRIFLYLVYSRFFQIITYQQWINSHLPVGHNHHGALKANIPPFFFLNIEQASVIISKNLEFFIFSKKKISYCCYYQNCWFTKKNLALNNFKSVLTEVEVLDWRNEGRRAWVTDARELSSHLGEMIFANARIRPVYNIQFFGLASKEKHAAVPNQQSKMKPR